MKTGQDDGIARIDRMNFPFLNPVDPRNPVILSKNQFAKIREDSRDSRAINGIYDDAEGYACSASHCKYAALPATIGVAMISGQS